ncbi:hypothetical protein [Snodgrassella alvi]|uniref:SLC26A/SulP transporter domain-containing protein n=1 Tax=Snodgrassella alvi TaxID=1196083 RepID=A0ABD7Z1X0_9NEIS|nr:hypothetical protein [Snodgrassella alvi]ORF07062.1 hypothetical protein BGH96_01100 [Snodgrassella alvi]UOO99674.1 hypothetical protein LVJ87_05610 [Snodgrassella alvi wkB2]WLS98458.1 hypothetical protein RAM05_00095 [Snodgrassella alvi]
MQPVPQEGGAVAWLAFSVQPVFFDPPTEGVVDVAVTLAAACLLNAYFAQAVFSIVVVVLGCADGLFAGSSAVLVVAVVVSSEMQELVTANQVVIAVVFSVFAVQQVGSGIVLQGFPVSLITAAFDSAGVIIAVIGLAVFAVFFAYQSVEVVVLVAAFDEDIRQDGILIAPYLFVLQPAVAVVFELGVQASLST